MARSIDELYAQIARLPAADRLRLAARILTDLADDPEAPHAQVFGTNGATADDRPPTTDHRRPTTNARTPERPNTQHPTPNTQHPNTPTPQHPSASPTRFIVVDGSNLLGRLPGYELDSAASRDRLALRLQEYAHAHPTVRVTLYFDGQAASTSRRGGVEIRYSPRALPADHFIVQYLQRLTPEQREHALLVTADRELADAGRRLGAAVETPEQFHPRIAGPPHPPRDRGLSKAEVAEWEEYFHRPPKER